MVRAYPTDVGRGIVRVGPAVFDSLDIEQGDTVHVGSRLMPAPCLRTDRRDWDDGIVRMDATLRRNTAVQLGESIEVSPVTPRPADRVTVAYRPDNEVEHTPIAADLTFALAARPLVRGLIVMIDVPEPSPLAGGSDHPFIPVVITATRPETTVYLTEETKVKLIPARRTELEPDDSQERTPDSTTDSQTIVREQLLNASVAR